MLHTDNSLEILECGLKNDLLPLRAAELAGLTPATRFSSTSGRKSLLYVAQQFCGSAAVLF